MIKAWTDAAEAGLLDRHGERGSTFAYLPDTPAERAVSITMPVRLPSWSVTFGLPPIFEMNLPEGVLRERLRLAFAKATGAFDEFDLRVASEWLKVQMEGTQIVSAEKAIKAVTYHNLRIERTKEGFETTIVFDV